MKIHKPITITLKQIIKLHDMCKSLFPGSKLDSDHLLYHPKNYTGLITINNIRLHWLEFCQTSLYDALQLRFEQLEGKLNEYPDFECDRNLLELYCWQGDHPIDQLYESFEELIKYEKRIKPKKKK